MDGQTHDVGKWDLLIAHPPCTYLTNAGARHLWKDHQLQADRIKCGKEPLKSLDGRVYDAEGLYGWWMQSKEVYGQCDLFAEMEGEK